MIVEALENVGLDFQQRGFGRVVSPIRRLKPREETVIIEMVEELRQNNFLEQF